MKIHKYTNTKKNKYTSKGKTACVAQPACRADVRFRGKANLGCWSLLVGQIQTVAESEADSRVPCGMVCYGIVWYDIVLSGHGMV